MKIFLIILLTLTSSLSFGQAKDAYVDGPANFRTSANGEKIFSVNNNVRVRVRSANDKWFVTQLSCYVKKDDLEDKLTIKSGVSLLDFKGDSIGFTYKSFDVTDNLDKNLWRYDEKETIQILLEGHTFEGNIKENLEIHELLASKSSYADSCMTTYLNYREENGVSITEITKCDLYSTTIQLDGKGHFCFVRKKQRIKRIGGAEGQDSEISLSISSMENEFESFEFSADADDIIVNGNIFKAVKHGCCGSENTYTFYNTTTGEQVMSFESTHYEVEIPNSKIKGFLGYTGGSFRPDEDGKMIVGILEFSDGNKLLKRVRFETKSKEQFDSILRWVPDMEFIPLNDQDRDMHEGKQLVLWTKNKSMNPADIWNFGFKVHLINDATGEIFSPTLIFKDGKVNNLDTTEVTVIID